MNADADARRSQRRGEVLRWVIGLLVLALAAWMPRSPALFVALCAGTRVSHSEADLDHDGRVSLPEAAYACNVESRTVMRKGRTCTEYYRRVDWHQVELICE